MLRWIMVGLTILGFALAFVAKGPGLLGFGLVLGFVGLFGVVFGIAAERVSAAARPDTAMVTPEDLAALRARRAAGASAASTSDDKRPPK